MRNRLLLLVCCLFLFIYFGLEGIQNVPATIKITIQVVTIILAVVSNLASVGSKISIEKDWVLVIANNDKERLTNINSIFRTIDLVRPGPDPINNIFSIIYSWLDF